MTYPVEQGDFLWLLDRKELLEQLGLAGKDPVRISVNTIRLLDTDGGDVTGQYTDDLVNDSWSGSKGTAEMGMVYVFIGITAILGVIVVRYFLINDKIKSKRDRN